MLSNEHFKLEYADFKLGFAGGTPPQSPQFLWHTSSQQNHKTLQTSANNEYSQGRSVSVLCASGIQTNDGHFATCLKWTLGRLDFGHGLTTLTVSNDCEMIQSMDPNNFDPHNFDDPNSRSMS